MPRESRSEGVNSEYYHTFWPYVLFFLCCGAVYLPNILVLTQAYVGNAVMVTYLGFILYLLISSPVLISSWFLAYYFKIACISDRKKSEKSWAAWVNAWRAGYEYKYSLLTWFISTTLAWVIQLCFYVYIAAGITTTDSRVSIGNPASVIGVTGKDEYYDDLFQATSLASLILYFIGFKYFLNINFSISAAIKQKL